MTAIDDCQKEIKRLQRKIDLSKGPRKQELLEDQASWQRKINRLLREPKFGGDASERAAHLDLVPKEKKSWFSK